MMNNRVYVMWTIRRPFFHKIGVSNRVDLRERQVGAKALFAVRLPYAYAIEAAIHRYMAPLNVRFGGDGGSEFFYTCNPIMALICLNVQLWFGPFDILPSHAPIVVFFLPIPFDAVLILLLISAVAYTSILVIVALLIYICIQYA